jgi:hypothetical protein
MCKTLFLELLERIEAAKDEGKWPTAADKDKSISRILEAHNTYDFDVQAVSLRHDLRYVERQTNSLIYTYKFISSLLKESCLVLKLD